MRRAVITIWTENSVKSDWVRAEAGRAKAEGTLIPVKTSDVAYGDIPLPFGEMHTENVGSTDLVRAAIVAQLAKPAAPVSQFWQITGLFKYNVLTWIGIVGSAITLFANLNGVLDLADWARALVDHWHDWTQMFWGWVFDWIQIKVPREFVPVISFIVFAALLVVGVNLAAWIVPQAAETQDATSAIFGWRMGEANRSIFRCAVPRQCRKSAYLVAVCEWPTPTEILEAFDGSLGKPKIDAKRIRSLVQR